MFALRRYMISTSLAGQRHIKTFVNSFFRCTTPLLSTGKAMMRVPNMQALFTVIVRSSLTSRMPCARSCRLLWTMERYQLTRKRPLRLISAWPHSFMRLNQNTKITWRRTLEDTAIIEYDFSHGRATSQRVNSECQAEVQSAGGKKQSKVWSFDTCKMNST